MNGLVRSDADPLVRVGGRVEFTNEKAQFSYFEYPGDGTIHRWTAVSGALVFDAIDASLADAESVLALLSHCGIGSSFDPSSHERIGHLWRTLLFNQFHDTLGGTSTVRATQDALEQLTGVIAESETLTAEGVRRLAAQIRPRVSPDDAAFMVVNLSGSDFDGLMDHEPWLGWDATTPKRLLDNSDTEIPFQDTRPDSRFMGIRHLVWRAHIPSFGYRVYRFATGAPTAPESRVTANETTLENGRFRLELDAITGGIKSMRDKLEGHELFPNGAHDAILVEDPTDTWSNGADRFGNNGEGFKLERTEVLETGLLRAVVRTHAPVTAEPKRPTSCPPILNCRSRCNSGCIGTNGSSCCACVTADTRIQALGSNCPTAASSVRPTGASCPDSAGFDSRAIRMF